MRKSVLKNLTLCIVTIVFCLLSLTACGSIEVSWLDADGTVLFTESVPKDEAIPQKELPPDSNEWHYTEWKQIVSTEKEATFMANRIEKTHVVWQDSDGNVLHEEYLLETDITEKPLPKDTEQWHYTEWKKIVSTKKEVVFVANCIEKTHVVWQDGDGNVLYEEYVLEADITEKPLPEDTEQWHYTGWKQTTFGDDITYVAERVVKQIVIWRDVHGNKLAEDWFVIGEEVPKLALPKDTKKWHYTEWSETIDNNKYTYVAERELKEDYFFGNVFQIVIQDLAGTPFGTGTGFVFNKEGWFITNAHVMENAYKAVAIFQIRNSAKNESFTTLEIKEGYYVDYDKDIFIGKIEGYSQISSYYNTITFQSKHSVGDVTYSVGYPNSSVYMEIHEGEIQKDLSSLRDKLYSGISYIASTSYTAPGSSGGILLNKNGEVIGMTTLAKFDDNNNFELGAAIEAYNYMNLTKNVDNSKLEDLALMLHPDEKIFIRFFKDFITWPEVEKIVEDESVCYKYTDKGEGINSIGVAYIKEENLLVCPNGYIVFTSEFFWDSGEHKEQMICGYYTDQDGLDNFSYVFKYTWGDGVWYAISSDNINYSENINLTLRDYTLTSSYGYNAGNKNIEYAKKEFNRIYELVLVYYIE